MHMIHCSWLVPCISIYWFLCTGWICLIKKLLINVIFIFLQFTDLLLANYVKICTSGKLEVQANSRNHYYISFQNVTGKWQEHTIKHGRWKYHLWSHWPIFVALNGFHRMSQPRSRQLRRLGLSLVSNKISNVLVSSRSRLKSLVHIRAVLSVMDSY